MNTIGKEVLWIGTSENNARNGEGAFIRLKNNDIIHIFSEFYTQDEGDDGDARLTYVVSHDEGETWSERKILVEKPEDAVNIMSVSLLRMGNGDIGLFYGRKNQDGTDNILLTRSSDEFETWSEPIDCFENLEKDYYVLNNDRILKMRNGRLIMPLARHALPHEPFSPGVLVFLASDDDGFTWHKIGRELHSPFPNVSGCRWFEQGLQEPGLYEHEDGTLWCYARTALGFHFESFSHDGGETWTDPAPNLFFSGPCSPLLVRKAGDRIVAIFNPIPCYTTRETISANGRTPYVMAVSDDDGKTWSKDRILLLEGDPDCGYCYPATIEGDGYLLVAYYYIETIGVRRTRDNGRIKKILLDELK